MRGSILAATLKEAEGQSFNIGNNREVTILDLAQLIRGLVGSSLEIAHVPYAEAYNTNFEETRRRVPDVRKAERVLGFRAEVSLEEGLRKTVDWFRGRR